jgi:hypothetical protein
MCGSEYICPLQVIMQMKEEAGSATSSGCHSEDHMGFLNSRNHCWVLPVDGIVNVNGPLSQFLVNTAFWIIWCQISQLLKNIIFILLDCLYNEMC